MATIQDLLHNAVSHHEAGRWDLAEQLYRQVLEVDPNHPGALYLLGVLAYQAGQHRAAAQHLTRAIRVSPTRADCHNVLGLARHALREFDQAILDFRRAIKLDPTCADAYCNLAGVLLETGKRDDAIKACRRALDIKPAFVAAQLMLGNILRRDRRLPEAATAYRRAVELGPMVADTHNSLGTALMEQGLLPEAISCYRRALELAPNLIEAQLNLGHALCAGGETAEAIASFRRVLATQPDHADALLGLAKALWQRGEFALAADGCRRVIEMNPSSVAAHYGLAQTLVKMGEPDAAIASYRAVIGLQPDHLEARSNLGLALWEHGQLDDALKTYDDILAIQPDAAAAHLNRALISLLAGRFAVGWSEYEWRWRTVTGRSQARTFQQPMWNGEDLHQKTILVHTEQGLGDALQFARYIPLVKRLGVTVVVECEAALLRVLRSCDGIDVLVERGTPLPSFDVQCPLLSLPRVFGTTVETIPAEVPYLRPESAASEHWRQELASVSGLKIGVVWTGSVTNLHNQTRSFPLRQFASISQIPGIRLFSLQKGAGRDEMTMAARDVSIIDLADQLIDLADTAAAMANLDLVITCESAPAHLAGALGVPVWVPLPTVPSWRWLLEREDSPWYPTTRLFRQQTLGDWDAVFDQLRSALIAHRDDGGTPRS